MLPLLLVGLPFLISSVSAALFPPNTQVKLLDTKGFRKAMKENATSVVAFVAPWCGHCQRMSPEYSKAAEALSPMVPLYAVDCDQESNKRLCAEQGVQGFPTVKLFPRGGKSKPIAFDAAQRTASNFFYWASRNIPHGVKRLDKVADVDSWVNEHVEKPHALLLSSGKDIPLMWKSLGNKYKDHIAFAVIRDKSGKGAVKMGIKRKASKTSKVLVYPSGATEFARFEGRQKYTDLDKYFKSVADGTAVFPTAVRETEDQLDSMENQDQGVGDVLHAEISSTKGSEPTRSGESTSAQAGTEPSEKAVDTETLFAASQDAGPDAATRAPDAVSSPPPVETPAHLNEDVEDVEEETHAKDEL